MSVAQASNLQINLVPFFSEDFCKNVPGYISIVCAHVFVAAHFVSQFIQSSSEDCNVARSYRHSIARLKIFQKKKLNFDYFFVDIKKLKVLISFTSFTLSFNKPKGNSVLSSWIIFMRFFLIQWSISLVTSSRVGIRTLCINFMVTDGQQNPRAEKKSFRCTSMAFKHSFELRKNVIFRVELLFNCFYFFPIRWFLYWAYNNCCCCHLYDEPSWWQRTLVNTLLLVSAYIMIGSVAWQTEWNVKNR